MRALLALEDGRTFEGESFGATGTRVGEICFNTSMTGYQEVLTDPSYHGQIVAMTYPHIGNYGTNALDQESARPHVRGFVIEELTDAPSSWRSEQSLEAYLRHWQIPGVQGIDTRALTRHLRERGAMKACLTTEPLSAEQAVAEAIRGEGVIGMDYVKEVTTSASYQWDPDDDESTLWSVARGSADEVRRQALPPVRHRIVAYDYGIKENILRRLRQAGFGVTVVPASTTAKEVLALKPDGVFLVEWPGRSKRARLRARSSARFDWPDADLRHLSRPSGARLRFWRSHLQTEIRSPRREPTGERSAHRKGRDHFAESRFCGRCRFAPARNRSHARESERRHGGRNAASRVAGFQRAISSRSGARSARRRIFLLAVCGTDRRLDPRISGAVAAR